MTSPLHGADTSSETISDRVFLTPAQAESLLEDGESVHNLVQTGFGFIGCDHDRRDAIATFNAAKQIEIGGPACRGMGHPLAVFDASGHLSFFAADMAKIEAFEAALGAATASPAEGPSLARDDPNPIAGDQP